MTVRVALATVAASTALFAGIGGGAGWAIGTFSPGYYRAVFSTGREPWFDPVGVGIGQGVGQGLFGGAVVGFALVALFVWRDLRVRRLAASKGESDSDAATW